MRMRWVRSVGVLIAGLAAVAAPAAGQVISRKVANAIADGVRYLRNAQRADGTWDDFGSYEGGTTALAILALITAGVDKDDPAVKKGLAALLPVRHDRTYVVSLKAMALAAADPVRYRDHIQACADDLARWQLDDGTWSYGSPARFRTRGDNSNTQYALLGLHEAAKAGARVNQNVFDRSDRWFRRTMADDGGWRYVGTSGTKLGTMTAAAVASLHITGGSVHNSQERGFVDGAAPNCGRYIQDTHILAGMEWLAKNFSVNVPPNGALVHLYYWYYAFERVGVLTGQRYIGEHDWFRLGAERLVNMQQPNGSWPGFQFNTCFAVLFLSKGRLPVLINKLRWRGGWNLDQDDAKNLCSFCNANKVFTEAVGWQVVHVDSPIEQWMDAPLVYLNGHEFPEFTPQQVAKIRKFLEAGGTLFVEACCGSAKFDAGFREFVRTQLPEYHLNKLDPSHPVYSSHYDFRNDPPPMFGVDLACRTSILYSPRDLSCLWQQQAINVPAMRDPTIRAFKMGANLAAYAAGREPLRGKLDEVQLPGAREKVEEKTIRGAVQVAQVMHTGDWRPCVYAMPNLTARLRDHAGLDVVTRTEPLRLGDPNLYSHPVLFMTGHHKFELTAKEKADLKAYLERGGFLFAEACCGRPAFDESLRALMAELFPKAPLAALPDDHPIITGGNGTGFKLTRIKYKAAALAESPNLDKPVLLAVTLGKRPAVIYSPYSLGCSLDGMMCGNCRGVAGKAPDARAGELSDAEKLGINIVLFALTN